MTLIMKEIWPRSCIHGSESAPRLSIEVHRFLCSGAKNWTGGIEIAAEIDSWLEEEDTGETGAETGEKL